MQRIYITLLCIVLASLTACKKDDAPAVVLSDGSVSMALTANKDTMQIPFNIARVTDTAVVIKLQAALAGEASNADHWAQLAVDTTKITAYRAKYGNVALLPAACYYFYNPLVRIAAGASLSDSAQLNIGGQSKLQPYTTYVLPVVVKSVDDNVDKAAGTKVLYLVFKTGPAYFLAKDGWSIAAYSSQNSTLAPTNVIDANETTTYWASSTLQTMPQYVTINFGSTQTFTAVAYYFPTALTYPSKGGYPTSIQIETSMDGTSWTNNGTFAGNIVSNMQTLPLGSVTARYLRFTSLAVVKYSGYDLVFIAGIRLVS
jgi:hypothetical protein